jgi:hypothetical protein
MSYRTLICLAATAIVGSACVSTDAFAYRGVRGGVYHGGVHRGAYVRPGLGIGAAAVGAAAYGSTAGAAYDPYLLSDSYGHYNYTCGYFPFNENFGHIGLPSTWKPC